VAPVEGHCPAAHGAAWVGTGTDAGYVSNCLIETVSSNQGSCFFGQVPELKRAPPSKYWETCWISASRPHAKPR